MGPLLFNIFLNDIFYSLTEGSLCNFADDNTISVTENLKFHIDNICKKEANQFNSLNGLARFMGDREKKIIMNSFILCLFNYCPLI